MARAPWAPDRLYQAAGLWVDECLRKDGSLFTPADPIWTRQTIAEASAQLLIDDARKLDFTTKLRDQVSGLSDAAIQFTAELVYVLSLSISNIGVEAKRELVEAVLGQMSRPVPFPDELSHALDGGVANYGAGITRRDRYVKYFVGFANAWKELDENERSSLLDDPWEFWKFVHDLGETALMQREAILHLVSPETFEYALLQADKAKIVKAFAGLPAASATDNVDRALYATREAVEAAVGQALNLYAPWFVAIWREDAGQWHEALHWAELLHQASEFDQEERAYKLTVGERMQAARSAFLATEGDWIEKLQAAFDKPNNMTHWQYEHGPFLRWCEAEQGSAEAFLQALWAPDEIDAEGVGKALTLLPTAVLSSPAARLTLVSVLLFGLDVSRYPPYRSTVVSTFEKLVGRGRDGDEVELEDRIYTPNELAALLEIDGKRLRRFLREQYPREKEEKGDHWELPPELAVAVGEHFSSTDGADPTSVYHAFVELLDELRVRLLAQGVQLRDLLDAQSIVWWLAKGRPLDSWSDEEKQAFLALQTDQTTPRVGGGVELPGGAWLVRGTNVGGPNVEGENLVPEWIEQGFVSIGWPELGDLGQPSSREELAAAVAEAFPENSPGSRSAAVGNLHRFLNLVRPGHLVVTTDGDSVYVGRVTGDSFYEDSGFAHAVRRRRVEWLNADSPASRTQHVQQEFPRLYSRMKARPTVTDMTDDLESVQALAGLVEKSEDKGAPTLASAGDELADRVYLPREWLQETIDLLAEKRQLIFYGPPGTGKTFLAQRLAEHLTGDGGAFEIVQFHPSYSYEDFFEGYRPVQTSDATGVSYELTPGPLRRIAEAAAQDPERPYVLVIDEINRGNLPKIFGELLFLLEYRDAQIPLQYSPESQFGLPENLYVIGTMNTADRSIALVDAALRRRFYFVAFMPSEAPVRDVLARWLRDKGLDERPARVLATLNERIASEEIAIGPSYLMTPDSTPPNLARIWKHAILPVLEEHFYGADRDVGAEFGLDSLEKALSASVEPPDTPADDDAVEAT